MLKTGIYKISQLNNLKNFKTIFGKDKKISITLYPEVANDPEKAYMAEKILLNFKDERGAFKRTYTNRFEEFDAQALKEIQARFSSESQLIVHDAAISDGRTACDFFEKLRSPFPNLTYYASDYDPYIFMIKQGHTKVVVNSKGKVLDICFAPFVFNFSRESRYYPLNHLIRFVLGKTTVKNILLKYQQGRLKAQEYLLFCPKAIDLANRDTRFCLLKHDLLKASPLSQPIDIFRAMNIFNPGYFKADEIEKIIAHIFDALSNNGLFIIGSNQDSNTPVHGGIFQKTKHKFEKIWQSGDGSSVEDFIVKFIP